MIKCENLRKMNSSTQSYQRVGRKNIHPKNQLIFIFVMSFALTTILFIAIYFWTSFSSGSEIVTATAFAVATPAAAAATLSTTDHHDHHCEKCYVDSMQFMELFKSNKTDTPKIMLECCYNDEKYVWCYNLIILSKPPQVCCCFDSEGIRCCCCDRKLLK